MIQNLVACNYVLLQVWQQSYSLRNTPHRPAMQSEAENSYLTAWSIWHDYLESRNAGRHKKTHRIVFIWKY